MTALFKRRKRYMITDRQQSALRVACPCLLQDRSLFKIKMCFYGVERILFFREFPNFPAWKNEIEMISARHSSNNGKN